VPERPREDLVAYLHTAGVDVIYPDGDTWHRDRAPARSAHTAPADQATSDGILS
jgi:hypothetical protein